MTHPGAGTAEAFEAKRRRCSPVGFGRVSKSRMPRKDAGKRIRLSGRDVQNEWPRAGWKNSRRACVFGLYDCLLWGQTGVSSGKDCRAFRSVSLQFFLQVQIDAVLRSSLALRMCLFTN